MKKNSLVAPVVKWVGGKRQLIDELSPLMPKRIYSYCEPFVGGGALLFHIQPKVSVINDINSELINVYSVIRSNVDLLIDELKKHKNESAYFYKIRDWDRDRAYYETLTHIQKAARLIYLNKTCYNGLFRVNNAGEFNAPFGAYKNPNIINAPVLKAVSLYFNTSKISFFSKDYFSLLDDIDNKIFVYLDPPYDPISQTANFTGYSKNGFGKEEQVKLRDFCNELDKRGILFMLSNSSTDFIHNIYSAYNITHVKAKRAINSVATKRGDIDEVVVRNYE
ncbi:MAG: DNA adenine methylase [Bacteroidales bacterium]|jgi:DNA adenine methylase|nr:DNA adenine methylase [Bacteroidales bacterium]